MWPQVLKDAPRLLQEEDRFPSSWDYLSFVTIDPALFIPACILPIGYYGRFIANTIICPVFLMCLVRLTFSTSKTLLEDVELAPSEVAWRKQRRHTEKLSRYYFAFFIAYPTQTQTFFSHVSTFCSLLFFKRTYLLPLTQLVVCFPVRLPSDLCGAINSARGPHCLLQ